ncbi:hypothetical protein P152DRAFT_434911 [Eremomyces bilateralis CBS 781.70]|uniref:Thiolase-like protein type 1 additional C-terminal domain-containing protein n=1 Tax=Eremomyces bilateralis CBS 781.70 TaxID=1392243 RepID=A0A6G1G3T1_9PEZI|nr:uncharacterized protein P152DRAFT_434911 [Eremomyces bilateralis CBS 781.70]KAF1812767.1 hypothetical protein P152DRAFT_434911 [Eremomyces bilateralis CBS 781.70]
MAQPALIPVIVGVGDIKNKKLTVEDAIEPMQLMRLATIRALEDTGLSSEASKQFLASVDSVSVVATWTWNYPDLPALLSEKLGISPSHKTLSPHGGNYPVSLIDEAARRVSLGQSQACIVTGGEALASVNACAAAKKSPPRWTPSDPKTKSVSTSKLPDTQQTPGSVHSIGLPIHIYPLYENGFRAKRRQTPEENNAESANLYAEFAQVAEQNPMAWNYGQPAKSAKEIGTVTKKNRLICSPYPLLMNAFNAVNLAGACLLTSTKFATEFGISEDKWIYPLGGAGAEDSENFWERLNYYSSPALSNALDAALRVCKLSKDDIEVFDFYSCFPIVPKLACHHLSLPIANSPKPVTFLGGLTSFGGAGNNYSMHSVIEMARELRKGARQYGLVLANGGILTKHNVLCLSRKPRKDGSRYPATNPLAQWKLEAVIPPIAEQADGKAILETYTVEFTREGKPTRGHIVGLLQGGRRFVAHHGDEGTLQQLASQTKEQVGRNGWVRAGGNGKNYFVFEEAGRL